MYSSAAESKYLLAAARLLSGWILREAGLQGFNTKSKIWKSISSGSVSSVGILFDNQGVWMTVKGGPVAQLA